MIHEMFVCLFVDNSRYVQRKESATTNSLLIHFYTFTRTPQIPLLIRQAKLNSSRRFIYINKAILHISRQQ